MIECIFKLAEKEFQDLMEIYLRRNYNHTRVEIFREKCVAGSVADFVVFSPYQKGIIWVYELKMYWDNDYKRLKRQVKDYLKVADYVVVAVFGGVPKIRLPDGCNVMNVKIMNGWLDYNFMGDKDHIIRNDNSNIDIKKRLRLMKDLRNDWRRKEFYANKIIGIESRRMIREERKAKKGIIE